MDNSKNGDILYTLLNIAIVIVCIFLYMRSLFRIPYGFTHTQAIRLEGVLMFAFLLPIFHITIDRHRSVIFPFIAVTIPLGIYTAIAYYPSCSTIIHAFGLLGFLTLLCVLAIDHDRQKKKMPEGISKKESLAHSLFISLIVLAITALFLMMTILLCSVFRIPIVGGRFPMYKYHNTEATWEREDRDDLFEEHFDELKQLEDDAWDTLDNAQKLEVLSTIVDIESKQLGIQHPLSMNDQNPEKRSTYNSEDYSISFNRKMLQEKSAKEILYRLGYHIYTAYESDMIDAFSYLPTEYKSLRIFDTPAEYEHAYYREDGFTQDQTTLEDLSKEFGEHLAVYYHYAATHPDASNRESISHF